MIAAFNDSSTNNAIHYRDNGESGWGVAPTGPAHVKTWSNVSVFGLVVAGSVNQDIAFCPDITITWGNDEPPSYDLKVEVTWYDNNETQAATTLNCGTFTVTGTTEICQSADGVLAFAYPFGSKSVSPFTITIGDSYSISVQVTDVTDPANPSPVIAKTYTLTSTATP